MIFEKESLSFNILEVMKLNQENVNMWNAGRNFGALSFRIHADTRLKTSSSEFCVKDDFIVYVPPRLDYTRISRKDELIVVHFDTIDYQTQNIEFFKTQNPEKLSKLFQEILNCWDKKEIGYKLKCSAILYEIFAECYSQNFQSKTPDSKIRNSVKLDVTLFESEQVGSPLLSVTPEYYDNGTPKEVDGILYDRYGNAGAYRFWTLHPGAAGVANTLVGDSYLVNADQVIHYANLERPGQHRGLSEFASTLNIFNDMRRYDAAVLAAAETAAEISFVLYTDNPALEDDVDDEHRQHYYPGTVMELSRNSGVTLPEGWKATQMKAEQPTSTHTEFIRTMLRKAARAFSMPLNVALGDSSSFNYASGRLDHQTYFRVIRGERALIEEKILDDLLRNWEQVDRVMWPEDYPADVEIDHSWMWDGFAHVDPQKEASAQNIRLNLSGTSTLAEECAMEGKDWGKVIRQRKRENDLKKRYGLPNAAGIQSGTAESVPEEDKQNGE